MGTEYYLGHNFFSSFSAESVLAKVKLDEGEGKK